MCCGARALLRHARSRQISAKRNHNALMAHRKLGLHRGDLLARDVPVGWYIEPKATRALAAHKVCQAYGEHGTAWGLG